MSIEGVIAHSVEAVKGISEGGENLPAAFAKEMRVLFDAGAGAMNSLPHASGGDANGATGKTHHAHDMQSYAQRTGGDDGGSPSASTGHHHHSLLSKIGHAVEHAVVDPLKDLGKAAEEGVSALGKLGKGDFKGALHDGEEALENGVKGAVGVATDVVPEGKLLTVGLKGAEKLGGAALGKEGAEIFGKPAAEGGAEAAARGGGSSVLGHLQQIQDAFNMASDMQNLAAAFMPNNNNGQYQ